MIQSSKWTRALVESLAALLLCIVIVGAFFLPHEFKKRQELPKKQVVSCCLSQDAKTVIALVATEHLYQPGNRILQFSTNSDQPTVRDITPDLKPECLALEPTGWRMFVGDVGGSIQDVRFDSGTVKSLLVGHVFRRFPTSLATTLDASKLVINDEFGLYVWKLDWQAEVIHSPIWNKLDRTITCFGLAPDSHTGFYGRLQHNRSQVWEFDTASGNHQPLFDNPYGQNTQPIDQSWIFLFGIPLNFSQLLHPDHLKSV